MMQVAVWTQTAGTLPEIWPSSKRTVPTFADGKAEVLSLATVEVNVARAHSYEVRTFTTVEDLTPECQMYEVTVVTTYPDGEQVASIIGCRPQSADV